MAEALLTLGDYRRAARAKLSPMAWRYFASGADAQRTLRENVRAYRDWQIWPRVLVDVAERELATTILGAPSAMPVMIAPTAYHKLAHPDGELATARGAAAAGVIACVSTLATTSLEDVAAATAAPKWFQLYVHKDAGLTRELVARAAAAGYRALVVTVDAPLLGRRLADERHGFALPAGLTMPNVPGGCRRRTRRRWRNISSSSTTRRSPGAAWRRCARPRRCRSSSRASCAATTARARSTPAARR